MAPTLAELESELSRDPRSRRFYELAREYQKQGRLDEAMTLCERGLGNYPSQWQARILLAQLYIGKGRLDEARTMVERVLLPLPDNVPANHLAADIYKALGDSQRALKHYRIVDLLDPGRAGVEEQIAELSAAVEPGPSPESDAAASPAPASASGKEPPAMVAPAQADGPETAPALEEEASFLQIAPPEVVPAPAPEEQHPVAATPEILGAQEATTEEAAKPGAEDRLEEDWMADTAAFDRELLSQEGSDAAVGLLGDEAVALEETGPLVLGGPPAAEEAVEDLSFPQGEAAEEGLNTATLAELYENQGFPEKAVEIYQRMLLRDPDNKAVRERIQGLMQKMAGEVPEGPAVHQEDVEKALRNKRIVVLQDWLRCVREGSHV